MPEKIWRRRPWTFASYRTHQKVHIPKIDTYVREISNCNQQYLKLRLTAEHSEESSSPPLPCIFPRSKTSPGFDSKTSKSRSAPVALPVQTKVAWQHTGSDPDPQLDGDRDEDLVHDRDKDQLDFDPIRLCEHLRDSGFGSPVMLTSSAQQEISRYNLPPGVKARRLPRNPSKREKIKGRARLDYEMANMRALAFCEQQAPKVFRTASANMRNRDVQFVEDEMKENVHRGEEIDDTGSVVMGMDRDELFQRIESWIEDVAKSWEKVP